MRAQVIRTIALVLIALELLGYGAARVALSPVPHDCIKAETTFVGPHAETVTHCVAWGIRS